LAKRSPSRRLHPGRVARHSFVHVEPRAALRHHLWLVRCLRPYPGSKPCLPHVEIARHQPRLRGSAFRPVVRGHSSIQGTKPPTASKPSLGVERDLNTNGRMDVHYEHEEGAHKYRRYEYIGGYSLPLMPPTFLYFAPTTAPAMTVFLSESSIALQAASIF